MMINDATICVGSLWQLYDEICKYALYFVGFAALSSTITAAMIISYDIVGEKLTTTLRESTFKCVASSAAGVLDSWCWFPMGSVWQGVGTLRTSFQRPPARHIDTVIKNFWHAMCRNTVRQDVGYFDLEENSTGAITARLATDATLVKAVAGQNQGRMVCAVELLITRYSGYVAQA